MGCHDPIPRPAPRCPGGPLTRRDFLLRSAVAAGMAPLLPVLGESGISRAPRAPVGLALCKRYDFREVRRALGRMLDEVGGVRRLVKGRHVTIKVNLVNTSAEAVAGIPLQLTVTVHPVVAMALGSLLVQCGARRVVYADQLPFRSADPEAFAGYGFRLADFAAAMEGKVTFLNTRNRGGHSSYALVKVPNGELATAWEVNRAYTDTDVLISLGKLKSHVSAGVTGGMKNLFGVPPSSLYGDDLGAEPDEHACDYRNRTMHNCSQAPRTSVTTFTGKSVLNDHGYNVPRFIVDLAAAFPIRLVVVDGISVIQTAEGWWNGSMVSVTRPGLLIAGANPVCTDAVAAAVMGFNPEAPDRTWPFANGVNYLALARRRGLGENRLKEIEVAGVSLERARFEFQPTYRRIAPGTA
jgi:uncharacterized protein (DUF362 family)